MADVAVSKRRRSRAEPSVPIPSDARKAVAYEALQRELAERLVMLRAEFREAVANYSVNVQGLLTQLADALREESIELSPADQKVRARHLRAAIDAVNALDLKPDKGRRRDLKRVENVAIQLSDLIAEW